MEQSEQKRERMEKNLRQELKKKNLEIMREEKVSWRERMNKKFKKKLLSEAHDMW